MSKKDKDVRELDCGTKVTFFNLKKALRGDDVVCRNGSNVNNLTDLFKDNLKYYCLAGVVNGELKTFDDDGFFCKSIGDCSKDLFMVYKEKPKKDKKVKNKDNKKTKRWVNVYRINDYKTNPCEGSNLEVSNSFESKKEAKEGVPDYAKEDGSYIKTIRIKF